MSDTATTEAPATGPKSQIWKHAAMVEWLQRTKGMPSGADAATAISYAFANRVEWRQSEDYRTLVTNYSDAADARKAEAKAAGEAERKAKADAKAADKAAADAAKAAATPAAEAKPVKATKAKAATKTETAPAAEATEEDPFAD